MSTHNDTAGIAAARLKERRVLIVSNLLNGVPDWKLAEQYKIDPAEVTLIFKQVMSKVRDYLFRYCKPPIACNTLEEAKLNRINLLAILPKINLDKETGYKDIVNETVTSQNYKSAVNDILR